MCEIKNHILLSESSNSQITWCKCCRSFSVIYNSCGASFMEQELIQFNQVLKNLRIEDFSYEIKGNLHAIIKNPCSYVGFCLTKNEVGDLISLIDESLTVYEAFQVIYG